MIKTKEELLNAIKERIGEDTSDEALSFIEDISDTLTDYETKATGDGTDWKQKFEENDKAWREKYRDRFFSGGSNDEDPHNPNEEDYGEPISFDDLFEREEK